MPDLASMWSSGILMAIIVFLLLVIFFLLFRQYKQKRDGKLELLKQKATLAKLEIKVHELAAEMFEEFKRMVLQTEQDRMLTEQKLMAEASFEKWKMEYETLIRQDAIKKSQAVTIGKVTQQIIPFFSGIFPYNPKEARFIGSTVDMVVFDAMETDPENNSVHFIEVKTDVSSLTPKQRAIKYAILNKRVAWKELRV